MKTFVVYNCKKRKNIIITQSARRARNELHVGIKIEVWEDSILIEKIYAKTYEKMNKYIDSQREYIAKKQAQAEQRNKRR